MGISSVVFRLARIPIDARNVRSTSVRKPFDVSVSCDDGQNLGNILKSLSERRGGTEGKFKTRFNVGLLRKVSNGRRGKFRAGFPR